MKNTPPHGPVADAVLALAEDMGYAVLEFSAQRVKGRTHVHCVVHRAGGIDLDRLTELHRALQPRLEALLDDRDIRLEFASPGVERVLKSFHEVEAFVGARARVLPVGSDAWCNGTIVEYAPAGCLFRADDGVETRYAPEALTKVRLVD